VNLRPTTPCVALLVALAFAPLAGCGDGPEDPAPVDRTGRYDASGRLLEGTRAQVALPNIVLLILDTTRADSIRETGGQVSMPNLAEWAKGATDFVDASAAAAWTAPSVTTVLTGLPPSEHGVQGRMKASPLVPAVTTLAEILQEAGYRTIAYTGRGWVSREMGLGQGFERFEGPWATSDPHRMLRRGLAETPRDKPIFLLLHTYEAHDPYGAKFPVEGLDDAERKARTTAEAQSIVELVQQNALDKVPAEEGRRLMLGFRSDPLYESTLSSLLGSERAGSAAGFYEWYLHPKDPERKQVEAKLRERYTHGLGLLDGHLPALFRFLGEADFPGRTVTIVVSDHGEAFGEHGAVGHGRWLIDPISRVMLLVRAPGRMPAGPVKGSCGLIDVTPTILDLCGLPKPESAPGRSLLALGKGRARGVPIHAEEFRGSPVKTEGPLTMRVVSVRTERAKVIFTWDPRDRSVKEQLFDLVADPAEEKALPTAEVSRFGASFVAAVEQARRKAAAFPVGRESEGDGSFSER
jgi:arylsulfatase A-like enzyme